MSRLLVLVLIVAAAYLLIKGLLALAFYFSVKKGKGGALTRPEKGGEMIQDPACGIYIPKEKAIEQRVKGEMHYFCSPQCLEKYKGSVSGPYEKEESR